MSTIAPQRREIKTFNTSSLFYKCTAYHAVISSVFVKLLLSVRPTLSILHFVKLCETTARAAIKERFIITNLGYSTRGQVSTSGQQGIELSGQVVGRNGGVSW